MIGLLAVRTLVAHPLRTAMLAVGFGAGVAVMALLLGVAEIVLQQAQSPALVGGGDVIVRLSPQTSAPLLMADTLQSRAFRDRVATAAPYRTADLYLVGAQSVVPVSARGGIPSLERALGDRETADLAAWTDTEADAAWRAPTGEDVLRSIDRFHPVPDAPAWADSWAEWLYFNGRTDEARFYLTFLVGPRGQDDVGRTAGVRLQLERDGRMESYSAAASVDDEAAGRAPDLTIGDSTVRLDGTAYRIHLAGLRDENGQTAGGDLTIASAPGRLVPPIEILGARGWRTGYVVPVTSGAMAGSIVASGRHVVLDGGSGYHDHNWGFWQGVTWRWGQVHHEDLSLVFGRVFPPPEAADPARFPGFVGLLGPEGPLGYTTRVRISDTDGSDGRPRRIEVRAEGVDLDVTLRFDVESTVVTRSADGPVSAMDFLQLRGRYRVEGHAGSRQLDFTAPGSAETFREPRED